jgi:hypothetical protein
MNFSLAKLVSYLNSIIILYNHFSIKFINFKTIHLKTMTLAHFPIYL